MPTTGVIGGLVIWQAARTVGAVVLWFLMVMFFYHGAKYMKHARLVIAMNRYCLKCGRHHVNPNAKFCRDCGGSILKVA